MEFLLWIIIFILLIGFGFTPVLWILFAMAVIYYVLVILGKIFMFFAEFFIELSLIFIEPKRAQPKMKTEEVKEVKRFPEEAKGYNEKVDKITDLTLLLGLLSIVFFSALIIAVG